MCKARIEKAALSITGVHSAKWDVDRRMLTAHIDPDVMDRSKLSKAIAKAGHDTELDKADSAVYNELPACCTYRDD